MGERVPKGCRRDKRNYVWWLAAPSVMIYMVKMRTLVDTIGLATTLCHHYGTRNLARHCKPLIVVLSTLWSSSHYCTLPLSMQSQFTETPRRAISRPRRAISRTRRLVSTPVTRRARPPFQASFSLRQSDRSNGNTSLSLSCLENDSISLWYNNSSSLERK